MLLSGDSVASAATKTVVNYAIGIAVGAAVTALGGGIPLIIAGAAVTLVATHEADKALDKAFNDGFLSNLNFALF